MSTPLPQNRCRLTAQEIAEATGGRLVELPEELVVIGVSTDSRTTEPGALFIALKGERFDGHSFAVEVRQRGACILVHPSSHIEGPRIEVEDPLEALGSLARFHLERERKQRALPVLAIGGAAGKTTTRALAAAGAQALFGRVLATAGNLNNRIGVPMTLLSLTAEHHGVVLECGTSEPGEIEALGGIVQPDVALVINAGLEHSERLGDLEAIAREEGALFRFARKAVVTAEDATRLTEFAVASGRPLLLFGQGPNAAVQVLGRRPFPQGGAEIQLRVRCDLVTETPCDLFIRTPLIGPTAARNLAAATAALLALAEKPYPSASLAPLAHAMGEVPAVPGRLYPRPTRAGTLFLDDTYNANPESVATSLTAAAELAALRGGRLHVLLGDMLELGPFEEEAHSEVLSQLHRLRPATVVLVGPRFERSLGKQPLSLVRTLPSSEIPLEGLDGAFGPADVVLFKGSRGIRMERILESLFVKQSL